MLADPRHSRLVLINPSRDEPGNMPAEFAARRVESLSLLPVANECFGVATHVIGDCVFEIGPGKKLADTATVLEGDGLSLWSDRCFTNQLAASNIGVVFLGGAWLEEEILIAMLEGARLGYDMRLLADVSMARCEADRRLVYDRLALHGVLITTIRQTLLEWAVCLKDTALKRKIQGLWS